MSWTVVGALAKYTVTNAGTDFTITKRPARWTTSALAAGETVAGGAYHITSSLSSTVVGALANYTANNARHDVMITELQTCGMPVANSKVYGDADPAPLTTGSGSGFVLADGVSEIGRASCRERVSVGAYHVTA